MAAKQDDENEEMPAEQAIEGELLEGGSEDEAVSEEPLSEAEALHQALERIRGRTACHSRVVFALDPGRGVEKVVGQLSLVG